MSSSTVAEFAYELKKPTDTLLMQLRSAGVAKSAASDRITESDKHKLLSFLQNSHGTAAPDRKKITLVKKQADASGRARTIQIEVRKKRTFVRREDGSDQSEEVAQQPEDAQALDGPVIDHAELARREEQARRQAELIRRQEEELSQRRKERKDREERDARNRAAQEAQARTAEDEAKKTAGKSKTKAKTAELESPAVAPDQYAERANLIAEAASRAQAQAPEEATRAVELGDLGRKAETETETETETAAIDKRPAKAVELPSAATIAPVTSSDTVAVAVSPVAKTALKEAHIVFHANQRSVSFDALFGPYLAGAGRITVTDPYLRAFHQQRNLMDLLETISKQCSPENDVGVHVITTEDEFNANRQTENFQKMADACLGIGIRFTWEYDMTGTKHDRDITTDHGWKIVLSRGLDVFQHFELKDAFNFANRMQQHRQCKEFNVTFVKIA